GLAAVGLKGRYHRREEDDRPLAPLGLEEGTLDELPVDALYLLARSGDAVREVNVIPAQTENLRLPEPGGQSDEVHGIEGVLLQGSEEIASPLDGERRNPVLVH